MVYSITLYLVLLQYVITVSKRIPFMSYNISYAIFIKYTEYERDVRILVLLSPEYEDIVTCVPYRLTIYIVNGDYIYV